MASLDNNYKMKLASESPPNSKYCLRVLLFKKIGKVPEAKLNWIFQHGVIGRIHMQKRFMRGIKWKNKQQLTFSHFLANFLEQCYDRNICIYSSLVPENITNLSWKVLLLFEAGSNYRENDLFIFWKDVFV